MATHEIKQEQRTYLRERFLRLLTSIQKLPAEFTLVNGNTVTANFGSSDVDVLHVQVNNLDTPLGRQPEALLRSTDIISFSTKIPNPLTNEPSWPWVFLNVTISKNIPEQYSVCYLSDVEHGGQTQTLKSIYISLLLSNSVTTFKNMHIFK